MVKLYSIKSKTIIADLKKVLKNKSRYKNTLRNTLALKVTSKEVKIFTTTALVSKSQYDASKKILKIKIRCADKKIY